LEGNIQCIARTQKISTLLLNKKEIWTYFFIFLRF
jgi:hypothetical protein